MSQEIISYIIVLIIAIFVILSFAIGLEKMIKVILGNYILGSICFAASISIDLAVNTLNNVGAVNFLQDAKYFIVFLLYVILFFLIYHKSNITIKIPQDQIMQKSLYLFFVPLTVLSMCLTLEIILLGANILNYNDLVSFVSNIAKNYYLQQFIIYTPYWILLHGLVTIIITSEMKTKIKTDV